MLKNIMYMVNIVDLGESSLAWFIACFRCSEEYCRYSVEVFSTSGGRYVAVVYRILQEDTIPNYVIILDISNASREFLVYLIVKTLENYLKCNVDTVFFLL